MNKDSDTPGRPMLHQHDTASASSVPQHSSSSPFREMKIKKKKSNPQSHMPTSIKTNQDDDSLVSASIKQEGRAKQSARKSSGGRAPSVQLATKAKKQEDQEQPSWAATKTESHNYNNSFQASAVSFFNHHKTAAKRPVLIPKSQLGPADIICGQESVMMKVSLPRALVQQFMTQYATTHKIDFCTRLYEAITQHGGRFFVYAEDTTNNQQLMMELDPATAQGEMMQSVLEDGLYWFANDDLQPQQQQQPQQDDMEEEDNGEEEEGAEQDHPRGQFAPIEPPNNGVQQQQQQPRFDNHRPDVVSPDASTLASKQQQQPSPQAILRRAVTAAAPAVPMEEDSFRSADHVKKEEHDPIILVRGEDIDWNKDILCGSAGNHRNIPSVLVDKYFDKWQNSNNRAKFCHKLYRRVLKKGGRFLGEQDAVPIDHDDDDDDSDNDAEWTVLTEERAVTKIARAFDDRQRYLRSTNSKNDDEEEENEESEEENEFQDETSQNDRAVESATSQPSDGNIPHYGEKDILCGIRGPQAAEQKHTLRNKVVIPHFDEFERSSITQKKFCRRLVAQIVKDGGRFLQRPAEGDGWCQVSLNDAREKLLRSFDNHHQQLQKKRLAESGLLGPSQRPGSSVKRKVSVEPIRPGMAPSPVKRHASEAARERLASQSHQDKRYDSMFAFEASDEEESGGQRDKNETTFVEACEKDVLVGIKRTREGSFEERHCLRNKVVKPNLKEFESSDKKTTYCREIIGSLLVKGGRFLQRTKKGYVVLSKQETLDKLFASFKNLIQAEKRQEQSQQQQQQQQQQQPSPKQPNRDVAERQNSSNDKLATEASAKLQEKCSELEKGGSDKYKLFVQEAGIADTLKTLQTFSDDPYVQANGLCLLCNVVAAKKKMFVALECVDDCIDKCILAMENFSNDPAVHMNALELVGRLWTSASVETREKAQSLIHYVKEEMESTRDYQFRNDVIKQGQAFLWRLSKTQDGRAAVINHACHHCVLKQFDLAKKKIKRRIGGVCSSA